jgi:hypothetical protein
MSRRRGRAYRRPSSSSSRPRPSPSTPRMPPPRSSTTASHKHSPIPYRNGDAIEDLHGDGTLHLYQDGQFRLAAAVCKDLLDSDIEQVLERLGVNVLLVPAMSIKTPNFPLAVARLLHTAQTLTVVANCPLVDDDGRSLPHCSLTARPTAKGLPVLFWPAGGAHAPRPQAPLWVEHPLTSGATARDHPLSGPKCH